MTSVIQPGSAEMVTLTVAFYVEDPDMEDPADRIKDQPLTLWQSISLSWKRAVSRVTAWWIQEEGIAFGHVELMFSDGSVASSTAKTGIHFDADRVLSNDRYTHFLMVRVSSVKQSLMQQFVSDRVGRPFNSAGRLWNSIGPLRDCVGVVDTEDRSYYCSELVTTLLKIGGLCQSLDPRTTNPTQLYFYLVRSGEGCASYNRKLSQIELSKREQEGDTGGHFKRYFEGGE